MCARTRLVAANRGSIRGNPLPATSPQLDVGLGCVSAGAGTAWLQPRHVRRQAGHRHPALQHAAGSGWTASSSAGRLSRAVVTYRVLRSGPPKQGMVGSAPAGRCRPARHRLGPGAAGAGLRTWPPSRRPRCPWRRRRADHHNLRGGAAGSRSGNCANSRWRDRLPSPGSRSKACTRWPLVSAHSSVRPSGLKARPLLGGDAVGHAAQRAAVQAVQRGPGLAPVVDGADPEPALRIGLAVIEALARRVVGRRGHALAPAGAGVEAAGDAGGRAGQRH